MQFLPKFALNLIWKGKRPLIDRNNMKRRIKGKKLPYICCFTTQLHYSRLYGIGKLMNKAQLNGKKEPPPQKKTSYKYTQLIF